MATNHEAPSSNLGRDSILSASSNWTGHQTFNLDNTGSNPVVDAKFCRHSQAVKALVCKTSISGSSPDADSIFDLVMLAQW